MRESGNGLRLNWSAKGSGIWEACLHAYRLSVHDQHGQAHWRVHGAGEWGNTLAGSVTDTTTEAKHEAEQAVARLLGWDRL